MVLKKIITIALAALFATASAEENSTQNVLTVKTLTMRMMLKSNWQNAARC